ncbi:LysR family transcriptional regulator [Cupriavidus sp. MP-37]|uniref:LysR family transcriptional regulator n=1 Tax=Cupriavidus sp. MP-37 TaxID=2884455 RepID=UPI001D0A3BA3|nr:LysR family transcriptional regulator [Cupriavidus sp. MP-37]UDM52746.1 LysR family transcriptional regulator [Cupriavidus sp. MP-37]
MNWDDARVFLALYREGTLRAAARALGVDQATVGRRLAALEGVVGATLFLRTSCGYVLTMAGESVLDAAQRMEQSANDFQRLTQGVDDRLAGEVRITTTDSLALDFLMPALEALHAKYPDIAVQIHASTQMLNLARREADLAIRTARPDNPDLIARRLAQWPMGLYASPAYLRAHGEPQPGTSLAGHDLVVYQPYVKASREPMLVGEPISGGRIVAAVNSSLMLRTAIKAGLGLGEIPVYMGEADGLVRLWPERSRDAPYEVWLVTHKDLRHSARIRVAIEQIALAFEGLR